MPVIVVTRLRLKDPAVFDEFFASAVAVVEQAQNSEGNLGADVLAEANNTYWTRTVWQGRDVMDTFVGGEPHLRTMSRIDDWCDEATFVEWEQASRDLPDWQDGYGRLVAQRPGAESDSCDRGPSHPRLSRPSSVLVAVEPAPGYWRPPGTWTRRLVIIRSSRCGHPVPG